MTLYSPGGLNLADTTAPLILAYDDTGTTDVVFAVSASGDLTITPDGGDVTVSGTLKVTGQLTVDDAFTSLSRSTSGGSVVDITHTHATAPFGVLIDFSAGAPDDQVQWFLQGTDSADTKFTIWSNGGAYFAGPVGIGRAADSARSLSVEETGASTVVARFSHTHASAPLGLLVIFSGDAPDDTTQYFLRMDDSAGIQAVIYSDGSYQGSANSYGGLSDRSLKQHIRTAESNWDQHRKLRWVDFEFTATPEKDRHGLVAQEAVELFPDCVYTDGQTGLLAINYMGIATETGKATQECQIRIEVIESREDRLESCVRHLVDVNPKFEGREDALALLEAA